MTERNYDFAGWVTKNDIKCSDGVIIKHDAFKTNDGTTVPLVWNHDYKTPTNVLGQIRLQNTDQGVYGYGYFNETEDAKHAKELVKHGDISSMSIGARKIKRSGTNVIHGSIYEVSLVMAGANPGARIETVMQHSDDGEGEEVVIHTGNLIHSFDDILNHKEGAGNVGNETEKTIGDVIETMNDEQKQAVYALLGMMDGADIQQSDEDDEEDTIQHKNDDNEGDGEVMKHNVFNQSQTDNKDTLKHGLNDALKLAIQGKASSFKDVLKGHEIKHSDGTTLQHGINSIEMLFPEAAQSTNGGQPILYKDPNTAYQTILNGVSKSPFARVKTTVADLSEDEARAKGYIKGNMKKEEFFSLIKRVTGPTTVYKKQKLDRDDIIDIEDFDVVAFMNSEMRMMLEEEIARAILIGDGRDVADEDKIDETCIRPIISDNEFFCIHKTFAAADALEEAIITAMAEYRGSGLPSVYIDPTLLAAVKLLKGTDGRYLSGNIPSNAELSSRWNVGSIIPTSFMSGKGVVIVNLRDYQVGSAKGGQVTNFDDFDIDFNQYKYLTETRLSGCLTLPKSAIHFMPGATKGPAADDTKGGLTYGERQADKVQP